jgi:hypothetical protein
LARDDFERRCGVARRGDVMAYANEDTLEGSPIEFLVVNDEDVGFTQ